MTNTLLYFNQTLFSRKTKIGKCKLRCRSVHYVSYNF